MKLFKTIQNLIFHCQIKKAIREANVRHDLTKAKYFVIMWKGSPRVIPKREIKNWIATRKLQKGITIQDIERKAIYATP